MSSRSRRAVGYVVPLLLVVALSLSGCADAGSTDSNATPTDGAGTPSDGGTAAPAPQFTGPPPSELVVEQLAPPPDPDAPEAQPGDVVAVAYVGRLYSTGEVFDSSEEGVPFRFELGAGQVIPGWEQGIAGLQVGERARLIIPPELAYGEAGAGAVIGPNETLVFDVELVEIATPPSETASPEPSATESSAAESSTGS